MYQCPNQSCKNTTKYSKKWYDSMLSDGSSGSICRGCNSTLVEVEKQAERQTAMIRTRGCSSASNPFAH